MLETAVKLKQFQAAAALDFGHKSLQLVPTAEYLVELVVPEAYKSVVLYGASIIDFVDIGPHAGAQTHMAGFSGRVKGAS